MSDGWAPREGAAAPEPRPGQAWEDVGRRLAGALDDRSSAVVVADDADAAAQVALGIGRVQALRRRVAIGDLVGELSAIQALANPDEPHGIADSFLHGVSISRVAHQAPDEPNLFVMPSGSEAVVQDEIYRSDRWRRLAQGFASEGALLLLVAPVDAPALQDLVDSLDGAVILGGAGRALGDSTRVIAMARAPHEGRMPAPRSAAKATAAAAAPPARATRRRWAPILLAAAVLALVAGAGALYTMRRSAAPATPARDTSVAVDTVGILTQRADSVRGAAVRDSIARDSVARAVADSVMLPALVPVNPADSAQAAGWAVELEMTNTPDGARLRLTEAVAPLPAATVSPAIIGEARARWFRVVAGALPTRAAADSLLASLRARQVLAPGSGKVVRAPLALLLAPGIAAADVDEASRPFAGRGLHPYALARPDGRVSIYAGAFATADEAAPLAALATAAGVAPALAWRVGRAAP